MLCVSGLESCEFVIFQTRSQHLVISHLDVVTSTTNNGREYRISYFAAAHEGFHFHANRTHLCFSKVTIDSEELAETQKREAAERPRPRLAVLRALQAGEVAGDTHEDGVLVAAAAALRDIEQGRPKQVRPAMKHMINLGQPSGHPPPAHTQENGLFRKPGVVGDGGEESDGEWGEGHREVRGRLEEAVKVDKLNEGHEGGLDKRVPHKTPLWQIAAILLSRAGKGGYAK